MPIIVFFLELNSQVHFPRINAMRRRRFSEGSIGQCVEIVMRICCGSMRSGDQDFSTGACHADL